MTAKSDTPAPGALASVRRYVRPRTVREVCELCHTGLAAEHDHLVEVAAGRLACACGACALLFDGRSGAKYRRVPRTVRLLRDFLLTDAAWDGLQIPINLAFLVRSTRAKAVIALYPSPAGATEALVSPEAWEALAADNPVLCDFESDVEALLVNRVGGASQCYRVGVDECYKLVAIVRTHWHGFSGGTEVWREIATFFRALNVRCDSLGSTPDA
jgi:hypothetical protein